MKIIKNGSKIIGIIFEDDIVMSDTVSGDYASHIEAPEESIPLSVAEYIASVLESNSQWDRFGSITVDDMYTVLNVVLGPEIEVTFICNESQVQEVLDFICVCEGSAVDIIEQVEANFDCRAVSPTTYDPFNWRPDEYDCKSIPKK